VQARKNPFLSSKDLETAQRGRLSELLDWVVEKTELLRKLKENLSSTIRALRRFEKDHNYFSDLRERQAISALISLDEILESLIDLERELSASEKTCEKAEKIVSSSSIHM
jgi:hypothetical protein